MAQNGPRSDRQVARGAREAKMAQNGTRSDRKVARRAREAKMAQNGTRSARKAARRALEAKMALRKLKKLRSHYVLKGEMENQRKRRSAKNANADVTEGTS